MGTQFLKIAGETELNNICYSQQKGHHLCRVGHIPCSDGLGQVKLPVSQVNLSTVYFYILYKQIKKIKNFGSRASKKIAYVKPCYGIYNDSSEYMIQYTKPSTLKSTRHVILVAITGTIILVPYLIKDVEPLQLMIGQLLIQGSVLQNQTIILLITLVKVTIKYSVFCCQFHSNHRWQLCSIFQLKQEKQLRIT